MKIKIVTIGVYGFDEANFFDALCKAEVDTFCDIRNRRGVRGATYAFANSARLQARLAELGIRYIHRKDLGPTKAVRDKQAAADKATKTAKRKRTILGEAFIEAYHTEWRAARVSVRLQRLAKAFDSSPSTLIRVTVQIENMRLVIFGRLLENLKLH